jgi:hypothetical protein
MKKAMVGLAVVAAMAVVSQQAVAQAQVRPIRFGAQATWANDFDFGVGARVIYPALGKMVGVSGLEGSASFDWFFPSLGNYFEINVNALYPVAIASMPKLRPYVGGGLNIAHSSWDVVIVSYSSTDIGLNALAGARFALGKFSTFAEAKIELSGGEQFAVTFGVLF